MEIVDDLLITYRQLNKSYTTAYEALLRTRPQVTELPKEVLVDVALLLRTISKMCDDCRKECNAIQELCEKIACVQWVQSSMNDTSNAEPVIRGRLARGSPDVKPATTLPTPNTNPEGFFELMRSIGAVRAARQDLVRPHWPGLTKYVGALVEKGKPLPKGIDPARVYYVYKLNPLVRLSKVELEDAAAAAERRQSGGKETERGKDIGPDWEP